MSESPRDTSPATPTGSPRRVVIAGGSGALGRRICADLVARGIEVVVLTRSVDPVWSIRQVRWDGETRGDWVRELDAPGTALINLAGKLVDVRPTAANIAELRRSRVIPTRLLADVAEGLAEPLTHWVQASTTAIWSDAGDTWCTEETPLPDPGLPQMTGVAAPWEEAAQGARCGHQTILRTSIVLDTGAPALRTLSRLTRVGLGGRVGSGQQWFSWIHIDDWLAIARAALGLTPGLELPDGVLVAATDAPVRNAELMAALRRHLHRPAAPPTPTPLLRLGAVVLRSDPLLGLTGRRARSQVLADRDFRFAFGDLDSALADLIG
ncbi:DUF1731 domain-containing protein [Williamsia sp. MIQD14]|uniref:DUF1731 domain-containing protein n=1 Tax=Williamsia sp. MIQD14 TaxID=3425703 RepID=UPI003DA15E31